MSKPLFLLLALLPTLASAQVPKAISVEPMAVPPGQTSTLIVRGTSLQESTSLWTNLEAGITRISGDKEDGKQDQLASAFKGQGTPPEGTLIVEAEDYDRGTWGKRPPFILNVGGANANVAEWDVDIAAAGNFVLELNYASGGDRPVKLSVNGVELTDQAAKVQTGGFGPNDGKWVPERVLSLRKGTNTIRLERTGGTPHFDKLALVPTTQPVANIVSVQPTDRVAPYLIDVPEKTAVGIRGMRIATMAGISNMLLFMVDDLPTAKEITGRTASKTGQHLTLPVGVEGYCDSTHADRYSFEVSAGDEISIEAVASRLGTRLDPVVKLLDSNGREVAFADDTPGLSGDCCIRHRFSESGIYFVTIEDALAGGSSSYRYRLRVGDFPLLTTPVPAAVQTGEQTEVRFAGYAVTNTDSDVRAVAASMLPVSTRFPGKTGSGFTQIAVSTNPQFVVNAASTETIPVPAGVSGVFSKPAESHRCFIDAQKGQRIVLTDRTRSRGVPALLAMVVRDEAGKQLAAVRKAGPAGQSLTWSAPRDGRFEIVLSELTGRGGPEFGYHVELETARPDFDLVVEKDNSILPQNGYAILKVTANRQGYNGPIQLTVNGFGDSPNLSNDTIAEKAKETRLKVYFPADMKTGETRAIEIVGRATIDERPVEHTARTIAAFRKAMPQATFPPTGLDGVVALSIGPEIPDFFGLSLDGGEILFPRLVGEVYFTVRVKDREKGFKDPVAISVVGFPEGFSASGGDRAVSRSDNNEYRFQLRGPTAIDRSNDHVRIVGEASFKGQTKEIELARVPFRVIDPLIITAVPDTALRPGAAGKLLLKARRFVPRAGGDKAAIVIEFDSVPTGVTLPKTAVIPAGRNETSVAFTIAKDAKSGSPIRLTARTIVAKEDVVVATTVKVLPE